jgi:hypothetical protein
MTRIVMARWSRLSIALLPLAYTASAFSGTADLLQPSDDERFRAVGSLNAFAPCTAALIASSVNPEPQRPALLLTAAHCVIPQAYEEAAPAVVRDSAAPAGWQFTPAYFQGAAGSQQPITVSRIVYATMKGADLAVVELDTTYGDLRSAGIAPVVLADADLSGPVGVDVAHIPRDGVSESEQFLRLSRCTATAPVRLFESARYLGGQLRTDCAGVAGGSSGAPVFRSGTREVVGVMITAVDPRLEGCGFNRPCELAARQPVSRAGASYASPIAPLAGALRANGEWVAAGLDKGDGVRLGRSEPQYTRSTVMEEGEVVPARWGVVVADHTRWIRFKYGEAASTDCARSDDYSEPVLAREAGLDRTPLPPGDGAYLMCVIGQLGIDNDWQSPRHASTLLRIIDDTPPANPPMLAITDETDTHWSLEIRGFSQADFLARRVAPGARCDEGDGYRPLPSPFVSLPKARSPMRFCVRARDEAGNLSPPGLIDLRAGPAA